MLRYTASIMATEAEFLKDLKPPDIEEVKVVTSNDDKKISKASVIRHCAEKLDEETIRFAIDNMFLQNSHHIDRVMLIFKFKKIISNLNT